MTRYTRLSIYSVVSFLLATLFTSCVFDYPDMYWIPQDVEIRISADTEWLSDIPFPTKGDEPEYKYGYEIKVFRAGTTTDPIKELTLYTPTQNPTTISSSLNFEPGDYDIYVWASLCDYESGNSIYYDTSDFHAISYRTPYVGDTNDKDAYCGKGRLTVEESCSDLKIKSDVTLTRPFGRYEFIATDVSEFIEKEKQVKANAAALDGSPVSPDKIAVDLDSYRVKISYPLYMPSTFDLFLDKPVDSKTNIYFYSKVVSLSDLEVMLGSDYVMVAPEGSGVQVALTVYDSEGRVVASSGTITIPIERSHNTIVTGSFLTTKRNDGIGIDPDFSGDYNIEIR